MFIQYSNLEVELTFFGICVFRSIALFLFSKNVIVTDSTFPVLNKIRLIKLGVAKTILMSGFFPFSTGKTNVVFEVSRFSGTVEMERFGSDVTSAIAH